ncbi:MAG TPA: hypothetical protein DDY13_01115 [Cytophagales bacterium]|jgi:hypothetical protein|nr:hypothetical protein [Cytophagales bacterium]
MSFRFNDFMENYAGEIGGQFSEYDKSKSVIIVPLKDTRYQAVLGLMKFNDQFNKTSIEFSSKVCPASDDIDFRRLTMENARTCYAKFVLVDDYIKVEGCAFLESIQEEGLKDIIQEVAQTADKWEFKMTGLDVN